MGNVILSHFPAELLSKEYIKKQIEEEPSLEIESSDENGILVWDNEDAKQISFHYLENMSSSSLASLIRVSVDIPPKYQIDKATLAEYLWNNCDRNAFITLEELVVIWSEPDDSETFEPSDFIDTECRRMEDELGDEYAYEIGSDVLGQLWFERNIVVVNMGEVVRTAERIEEENQDMWDSWFKKENQVIIGFLTTAIHELRHLQLDTNILLPEDMYPLSLGSEDAVEEYCREAFERSRIDMNIFPHIFEPEKPSLVNQIQSASSRAAELPSNDKASVKNHSKEL